MTNPVNFGEDLDYDQDPDYENLFWRRFAVSDQRWLTHCLGNYNYDRSKTPHRISCVKEDSREGGGGGLVVMFIILKLIFLRGLVKLKKSENSSDWPDPTHSPPNPFFFFLKYEKHKKQKNKQKKLKNNNNPSWGLTHPPTYEFFLGFLEFFYLTKPLMKPIDSNNKSIDSYYSI